MRDETPRIHAAGAELVVLGTGTPQQVQWFVEDLELATPVLTDPDREVFEALGMRRDLWGAIDPRVFLRSFQVLGKGIRQKGTKGDATQLGGVLVVAPGGQVPYAYRSRFAGDHPAVSEVLEALGRV